MNLSPKHLEIRDFILSYQAKHNERPSLKEIASACEITHIMTVNRYISRLAEAGELTLIYVRPADKSQVARNS